MDKEATDSQEMDNKYFSLKSQSSIFSSRSDSIFGNLGVLEEKHSAYEKARGHEECKEASSFLKDDPNEEDISNTIRKKGSQTFVRKNKFSCQSSETRLNNKISLKQNYDFKAPKRRPPRNVASKLPDYKRHPEKWSYYNLEDVSEQTMSEKSNTKAAFAFLNERQEARLKDERERLGLSDKEAKFDTNTNACSKGTIKLFSRKNTGKQNLATHNQPSNSINDSREEDNSIQDGDASTSLNRVDNSETTAAASSTSFKARRTVKRHIRKADTDDD